VEMAVDICPHCYRCALPQPPRHRIAPPGSPIAAAASTANHHCVGVAQEEEERWVPCAERERERGVRMADGWVPRAKRERERGVRMADGWVSNSAAYTWAK
jgi:hypothetical protein